MLYVVFVPPNSISGFLAWNIGAGVQYGFLPIGIFVNNPYNIAVIQAWPNAQLSTALQLSVSHEMVEAIANNARSARIVTELKLPTYVSATTSTTENGVTCSRRIGPRPTVRASSPTHGMNFYAYNGTGWTTINSGRIRQAYAGVGLGVLYTDTNDDLFRVGELRERSVVRGRCSRGRRPRRS